MSIVISKKNKVIFFHLPKNAGTSISNLLLKNESYYFSWVILSKILRRFSKKDNFFFDNFQKKIHFFRSHETVKSIQNKISSKIFDNYFKFAIVRNPYSRFVSRYNYTKLVTKNKNIKFSEFVKEYVELGMITDQQYKFLLNNNGDIGVNKILKFENISKDINEIANRISVNPNKLYKMNVSTHDNYKEYYDTETKNIVENFCKEDLNFFNYKF
tara:strand:+ start:487 stop:1128 length:642 start_codon:yes stop_codon:yes gene_type:complete